VIEPKKEPAVVLTVPATAEHLALLRSLVAYYAGRERFTIDQIDDLKMAVDEAGVQLLRRVTGDDVRLELTRNPAGVVVRVGGTVEGDAPVIDDRSFSWVILQALVDELEVEREGSHMAVVLAKHQFDDAGASGDVSRGGKVDG
jgi:serine/threonine-protein kinase RsbW